MNVTLTPRQRGIRTALQVLAGMALLVVPLVMGLGLPAATVAAVGAIVAFVTGAVAVIQNALEENGVLPVLAPGAKRQP